MLRRVNGATMRKVVLMSKRGRKARDGCLCGRQINDVRKDKYLKIYVKKYDGNGGI